MADFGLIRTQMGAAAVAALGVDGASVELGSGRWRALSGLPAADLNCVLIHEANADALRVELETIAQHGCPTLLFLAGEGKALGGGLSGEWSAVGAMPIMAADLGSAVGPADTRVKRVLSGDASAVTELLSAAFDLEAAHVRVLVDHVVDADLPVDFWMLEDDGRAVSTVMTHRVDRAVSLWCMATPPQFARRGYARSLLAHVLGWAQQDGATVGLLGATPAGEPLYRSTGWTVVESWDIHLNAHSAQFG